MKKILTIAIVSSMFALSACGSVNKSVAQYTGYSNICVDHVNYLQFSTGATVQVDGDGKPVKC